jgi:hypothetical protein
MYKSIKTKAELKRLAVGTRLIMTNNMVGRFDVPSRTIKQIRSNDIIMSLEDGRESYSQLNDVRLEPTEEGFKLIDRETGVLCVEYKVLAN